MESALYGTVSVRPRGFDYVVVGAGFVGSVVAERLLREAEQRVMVVARRPHLSTSIP